MKNLVLLLVLITALNSVAQKVLTFEEAVEWAMKNNFNLKVAQNEALMAKTNNTWGNAGMLPNFSLNGSGNLSWNSTHQTYSDGTELDNNSLHTQTLSAGPELNWTLFESGRIRITKSKLAELEALGGIQLKDQVMQTLYDVTEAYYVVVKQNQQLRSLQETINYNKERVKITETAYQTGLKPKTDWLQAKIDLNVNMENSITQQTSIDASKRELNLLLGTDQGLDYQVADSIPLANSLEEKQWFQLVDSVNTTIQYYQKQVQVAQLALKETNRSRLPSFSMSAGYGFSLTGNSSGSLLTNQNRGPKVGAFLSVPIYQAGDNQRKIQLAKIGLQTATDQLSFAKLSVQTALQQTLSQYIQQKQLWGIEKENHLLAKENLEICLQRLKLGQSTSLEVHQTQEDFEQSATRLIQFEYNLKLAETKLKQLTAALYLY